MYIYMYMYMYIYALCIYIYAWPPRKSCMMVQVLRARASLLLPANVGMALTPGGETSNAARVFAPDTHSCQERHKV
jgi:hypothetical protein